MFKKIRNYLITGLIVLLPLLATSYIILKIVSLVDGIFSPIIRLIIGREIYGLGFIITFVIVLGVGIVATNVLGKKIISIGERLLTRIPIVRKIYLTIQQILDALLLKKKTDFRKVVLVEYPKEGIYQLGFLTYEGKGEVQNKLNKSVVNVFMPTTPNPTSGMLILVPTEDIIYLDMTIEEGLKWVISGGTIVPEKEEH
ncbi:DUF502 domain-containing protein [Natroniella sulfidigena]|uniref:DUF502 domain-containing protein n=1 Tax=Natroniella sulfidigena TaxID=723921 RepID=UPI00200B145F|nr:DUF502 domain-containing protein [Natroniella sulfidigena]MCK8815932.1 DUF502 domain-containing protein [Natroniella sulfidigena]